MSPRSTSAADEPIKGTLRMFDYARLIRQLAGAMASVWHELGLPLGRDCQPEEQRTQTVAAGG